MGKPAARLGDMTAHGGALVLGFPTVLIGGMPAARIGDMHVCPMLTPGLPPIPHVGGPVTLGSPTVLIGGMPAARMGDMLVCVGPPDTIALGCPTVLIGEAGSGSGSGGGAGGAGAGGAGGGGGASEGGGPAGLLQAAAQSWQTTVEKARQGTATAAAGAKAGAALATGGSKESSTREGHWIEFAFVDSAGLPVSGVPYTFTGPDGEVSESTLAGDGRIRRDGLTPGQGEVALMSISNAAWSRSKATIGQEVKMTAEVDGFAPGTSAVFRVFQRDLNGADVLAGERTTPVQGGNVEASWAMDYDHPPQELDGEEPQPYSRPQFFFEVAVGTVHARSGLLTYEDSVEITLNDEQGKPMGKQRYILTFSNGEVRQGKLDARGYAKEEHVPLAHWSVVFPDMNGFIE